MTEARAGIVSTVAAVVVSALLLCGCEATVGDRGQAEPESTVEAAATRTPAPTWIRPKATPTPGSISITAAQPISAEEALKVVKARVARGEGVQDPLPTPTVVTRTQGHLSTAAPQLGLLWTREAEGAFSQADAELFCEQLTGAGYDDWRLPSIDELEAIMGSGFYPSGRATVHHLWSSTPNSTRGFRTWHTDASSLSFLDGAVAHAICVRGLDG